MTATHDIKVNGRWYKAGSTLPAGIQGTEEKAKTEEENTTIKYTKTDIMRMTTAELQYLATEVGIDNAYTLTGGELKKRLTEYFGL